MVSNYLYDAGLNHAGPRMGMPRRCDEPFPFLPCQPQYVNIGGGVVQRGVAFTGAGSGEDSLRVERGWLRVRPIPYSWDSLNRG
jgi:hypothetical protein